MAEKPDRILTAVNMPLMKISRGINMMFIVNIHIGNIDGNIMWHLCYLGSAYCTNPSHLAVFSCNAIGFVQQSVLAQNKNAAQSIYDIDTVF